MQIPTQSVFCWPGLLRPWPGGASPSRSLCSFGALLVLLIVASGCRTAGEVISGEAVERISKASDLGQADLRFEQKQYRLAAALYRQLLETYPEGKARERILIQIGRCFYNDEVQSLHDAQVAYREYLKLYPEGHFVEDAGEALQRIDMIRANRERKVEAHYEQAAGDLEKLQAVLNEHPYDAELYIRIGNALWDLKRYDEAVQYYQRAQEIDAAVMEYDLLRQRMIISENGEPVPMTPERRRWLERQRTPLVVFDTTEYKSRATRSLYGAREVYYNVQGKVRNQSERTMQNVVVEVVFYNSASEMRGVEKAPIGTMPPGSVRAFSVRGTQHDNIYNIARYDCRAYGE